MTEEKSVTDFATASQRLGLGWTVLWLAFLVAFPFAVFFTPLKQIVTTLSQFTGGWINGTLWAYLVAFLAYWLIVIRGGRLTWRDAGWDASQLRTGVLLTGALWIGVHLFQMTACWVTGNELQWNPEWPDHGVPVMVGALLGQILGNALFEEMVYRHLLVTQTMARLRERIRRRWLCWVIALAMTQGLFALVHVPNRLANGLDESMLPVNLLMLFGMGQAYAWGYFQTRNLFFVVGWHALTNRPTMLIDPLVSPGDALLAMVLVGLSIQAIGRAVCKRRGGAATRLDESRD